MQRSAVFQKLQRMAPGRKAPRRRRFDAAVITSDHRQGEHAECGLAALAIAMSGHGVHVRLETLRQIAGSTLLGVRIGALRDLAKRFGLQAAVHRAETHTLSSLGLPVVCHMRFIHFVAVEAVGLSHVRVNDPTAGPGTLSRADFDRDYTGLALRLAPGGDPATELADGRPFGLWPELLRRLRPATAPALLALTLSAAGALAFSLAAVLAGSAIDGWRSRDFGALLPAAGSVLVAISAGLAAQWILGGALRRLAARLRASVIGRIEAADPELLLLRRPHQLVDKLAAASVLADAGLVTATLAAPAGAVLLTSLLIVSPLGGAIAAISLAVEAGLCRIATARGSAVAQLGSGKPPVISFEEEVFARPDGWGLGGGDEILFDRLAGRHAALARSAVRAGSDFAGLAATLQANRALRLIGLAWLGGSAMAAGTGTLGQAATLLALAALLSVQSADLLTPSGLRTRLKTALLSLADLDALPIAKPAPQALQRPPAGARIELGSVSWRPARSLPAVVQGVSGSVESGSVLAIIGPSGAGATTVCRMIAGLLRPSAGEVLVDGVPPDRLAPGSIALVERDEPVLPGSVRANLLLGAALGDDEMEEALAAVGIATALASRGGLDLVLSGYGMELSGGERARLLIARALLRRPAVLILDGVLDGVESELAADIVGRAQAGGATVVLATARAETAALADSTISLPLAMASAE